MSIESKERNVYNVINKVKLTSKSELFMYSIFNSEKLSINKDLNIGICN